MAENRRIWSNEDLRSLLLVKGGKRCNSTFTKIDELPTEVIDKIGAMLLNDEEYLHENKALIFYAVFNFRVAIGHFYYDPQVRAGDMLTAEDVLNSNPGQITVDVYQSPIVHYFDWCNKLIVGWAAMDYVDCKFSAFYCKGIFWRTSSLMMDLARFHMNVPNIAVSRTVSSYSYQGMSVSIVSSSYHSCYEFLKVRRVSDWCGASVVYSPWLKFLTEHGVSKSNPNRLFQADMTWAGHFIVDSNAFVYRGFEFH